MEQNIDFLLKNKHTIELLLLKNGKKYDDCLNNQSSFDNKNIMVEYNDVNDILYDECYEPGIYGFLNYHLDLKYDKMLSQNYEFNNKPGIVKKLIQKNNLSEEAITQNYGLIEMFEKQKDGTIVELKKFHLLKNTNINHINETQYDKIIIKTLPSDYVVTQIYKFDQKIMLMTVMTKSEYIMESNENESFIKYDKMIRQQCGDNKKMLSFMTNFDHIYRLNKINDDTNESDFFNLNDVLDYDFSAVLTNIKTTNTYGLEEYNALIEKYFGLTINDLFEEVLEKYDIMDKTKPAIRLILEIIIRLYIDVRLGNKRFNLSKNLVQYIPNQRDNDIYSHLKSQILIDRHWRNLLGYDEITIEFNTFDIKPMILSVFQMLKKHNMDYVLNYLEQIVDKNDKILSF
jgi:hypothetical protein